MWKAGGKLSLATVLRCRVSYFTEGMALGRRRFVQAFGAGFGGLSKSIELEGFDLCGLRFYGVPRQCAIRAPS